MVQTTTGTRVFDDGGKGIPEDQAKASAKERNARAEEMGIKARYEAVPLREK